jgi:hypothetical protein
VTKWFRHHLTGDKGFLVEENGERFIQYDRGPTVKERVPFNERNWSPEEDQRPLTKFQIGNLAYECDLAVGRIGVVGPRDRKPWLNMTDAERSTWTANGPPKSEPMRRMMWEAVQAFGRTFAK